MVVIVKFLEVCQPYSEQDIFIYQNFTEHNVLEIVICHQGRKFKKPVALVVAMALTLKVVAVAESVAAMVAAAVVLAWAMAVMAVAMVAKGAVAAAVACNWAGAETIGQRQ